MILISKGRSLSDTVSDKPKPVLKTSAIPAIDPPEKSVDSVKAMEKILQSDIHELFSKGQLPDLIRRIDSFKERAKGVQHAQEYGGANWPLRYKMEEFRRRLYQGVRQFPDVKEISDEEYAEHPCISGSYTPEFLGSSTTQYMDGIRFTRYARVLMVTVQGYAGYGVASVAVPKDPEDWSKSQHQRVPLKMRHWSFCLCDHDIKQSDYRMCNTTYKCSKCDWTYEVDSSG